MKNPALQVLRLRIFMGACVAVTFFGIFLADPRNEFAAMVTVLTMIAGAVTYVILSFHEPKGMRWIYLIVALTFLINTWAMGSQKPGIEKFIQERKTSIAGYLSSEESTSPPTNGAP